MTGWVARPRDVAGARALEQQGQAMTSGAAPSRPHGGPGAKHAGGNSWALGDFARTAGSLKYGTHLRTPTGAAATVLISYRPRATTGWMWDLTVKTVHDFYIQTTATAIRVHNCDDDDSPALLGRLADMKRYIASKPDGDFDGDFLNIRGTMAGGKKGVCTWNWT